jgi:hypothetical protein
MPMILIMYTSMLGITGKLYMACVIVHYYVLLECIHLGTTIEEILMDWLIDWLSCVSGQCFSNMHNEFANSNGISISYVIYILKMVRKHWLVLGLGKMVSNFEK